MSISASAAEFNRLSRIYEMRAESQPMHVPEKLRKTAKGGIMTRQ
jgi:hypothetical protein